MKKQLAIGMIFSILAIIVPGSVAHADPSYNNHWPKAGSFNYRFTADLVNKTNHAQDAKDSVEEGFEKWNNLSDEEWLRNDAGGNATNYDAGSSPIYQSCDEGDYPNNTIQNAIHYDVIDSGAWGAAWACNTDSDDRLDRGVMVIDDENSIVLDWEFAPNSAVASDEVDFQGNATHEAGHFTGMVNHFTGTDCDGGNPATMCQGRIVGENETRSLKGVDEDVFLGTYAT